MSNRTPRESRRDFIKAATAGVAGTGLSLELAADAQAANVSSEPDEEFDVVVVGGGVAGCYAAYRLVTGGFKSTSPLGQYLASKNQTSPTVGLFEYSGRIGGRLLSPDVPGITGYTSEFGGFRFNHHMHIVYDTAQEVIKRELGAIVDEPFPFDEAPNVIYVRGQQFTREQISPSDGKVTVDIPYNLRPSEEGMSPGALGNLAADYAFGGPTPNKPAGSPPQSLPNMSRKEVLQAVPVEYRKDVGRLFTPAEGRPNGFSSLILIYQANFLAASKDPDRSPRWAHVKRASDLLQEVKENGLADGRPLKEWDWWALKRRYLSEEACRFIEDTDGYDVSGTTGNVGSNNLYENFYFPFTSGPLSDGADTAWRHITKGYSAIPGGLYSGFLKKGGQGFTTRQLVRIDRTPGADSYDLLFYKREPGRGVAKDGAEANAVCESNPDACVKVRAKFVILALPKRSIEQLFPESFFVKDPKVQKLVKSAGNVPAIRMFLAYREPWWIKSAFYRGTPQAGQPVGPVGAAPIGRSTTDLGIRQFYYWFTESTKTQDGVQYGNALVLATYSNGQSEQYWRGLQEGQEYDNQTGGSADSPTSDIREPQAGGPRHASAEMAMEAHRQLIESIGPPLGDDGKALIPPLPYYAHFQNWTKDPWGAGWHNFNSGANQNEVIKAIRQPLQDESIYVVGEAFSNVQGWVQGALNSAESTLQCKLGLTWPAFVRKYGTWLGPGTRWLLPNNTGPNKDDPCIPD